MFANDPEMAKSWAAHTKNMKSLPEEKGEDKEASARQKAGASLLEKAANMLANRINKPKVPLPSAVNPNPPTAGIKPVQQNPLTPATQQYGANAQQAVQQKAQQLGQQATPKMAFLRKLAAGRPALVLKDTQDAFLPKKPDTTPTVPTPMPAKPKGLAAQVGSPMAGRIDTNTGKVLGQKPAAPDLSALPGYFDVNDRLRQQVMSQDNLVMHGINSRLVNPEDSSVTQIGRFNAIAPLADLHDRNTLKDPNKPLTAEYIQDVVGRDSQKFNEFVQENSAYEGAPFSWVDALKNSPDSANSQQKQLAEAYLQNRIQATSDVDSGQRAFKDITRQQLAAELQFRNANAFAKRWTGLDEATLNRLSGTVPEELKLRARSGDANAVKEIQKLEGHYANRGALGYTGDIFGTAWDMINSNAGMLAGGLAGATLKATGRVGTAALTRNMATNMLNNPAAKTWANLGPRAVAATAQGAVKAPAAIGEAAGGLLQGIGTFNTQVGLGREALTPVVGEDAANNIANLAATTYFGGKGLVYDPAKALITKGLPGLVASVPGMIPSGIMSYVGGKDIYKNRDTLANDLNPYATDKDVNLTNFDRAKTDDVGPIHDAVVDADSISPNAVLNSNQPLSIESFNNLPKGFPSHMAAANSDAILRENPQIAEMSSQVAQLNTITDPVSRNAARINLGKQVIERFGSTLEEFEAYNRGSNDLRLADKRRSDSLQTLTAQVSGNETDPSRKADADKSYTDALTNYETVSRQSTEKAIPFLIKYQNNQYKKVIAPMEKELPSVAQAAQKAMSDRLRGITTPEGEEAIATAAKMEATANRHSYSNAMLSLMRYGKITKADLDLKMGADPTAAKSIIDGLFQGKAIDDTKATEGYKVDPNTLQAVPSSQYKDNSAAELLASDSKRSIASSLNQQSNGGLENNPGLWSKLTNEVWGKMQPWEKTLTLGGLSLGAIGLFSSLAGGDKDEEDEEDDEDDEDSGGSFMPLLAIAGGAAALASPMARYFGSGNTQAQQPGQQGV